VIDWIESRCLEHEYSELATDAELAIIGEQVFYEKQEFVQVDRVVEYRFDLMKT
jgi:hypothetical protein